jgi:hypothetical protein
MLDRYGGAAGAVPLRPGGVTRVAAVGHDSSLHTNETSWSGGLTYASQPSHTNDWNISYQSGFSPVELGDHLD